MESELPEVTPMLWNLNNQRNLKATVDAKGVFELSELMEAVSTHKTTPSYICSVA